MKLLEYREAVKRTCPTLSTYLGPTKSNNTILDSIHMVLGMMSEVYELNEAFNKDDKTNIREELVDILWYACNYANKHNIKFDDDIIDIPYQDISGWSESAKFQAAEGCQGKMIDAISELANYDKKELAYEKEENIEIKTRRAICIQIVISGIFGIAMFNEQNIEEGMQQNINKLLIRFPIEEGFSTDRANSRNLKEERKQLEN